MISDHTVLKMAQRQRLVNILSKTSSKNIRAKGSNKKEPADAQMEEGGKAEHLKLLTTDRTILFYKNCFVF